MTSLIAAATWRQIYKGSQVRQRRDKQALSDFFVFESFIVFWRRREIKKETAGKEL